jgi:hypothetical protein
MSAGATAPMWPELKLQLLRFARWWVQLHRRLWAAIRGRRRERRLRNVLLCLAVDFVIAVVGGSMVALAVSPLIQG